MYKLVIQKERNAETLSVAVGYASTVGAPFARLDEWVFRHSAGPQECFSVAEALSQFLQEHGVHRNLAHRAVGVFLPLLQFRSALKKHRIKLVIECELLTESLQRADAEVGNLARSALSP